MIASHRTSLRPSTSRSVQDEENPPHPEPSAAKSKDAQFGATARADQALGKLARHITVAHEEPERTRKIALPLAVDRGDERAEALPAPLGDPRQILPEWLLQ